MMRALANTRFGNYMLGDAQPSPVQAALPATASQGHAAASSSMVEYPPIPTSEHTMRRRPLQKKNVANFYIFGPIY